MIHGERKYEILHASHRTRPSRTDSLIWRRNEAAPIVAGDRFVCSMPVCRFCLIMFHICIDSKISTGESLDIGPSPIYGLAAVRYKERKIVMIGLPEGLRCGTYE